MFAGSSFAGTYFAGVLGQFRRPRRRFGAGGSGMSDEEYRRLLRRLGARISDDMTGDDLDMAAMALRELGML